MGIGGSIFLIALGAILAFAVKWDLGWLDLNVAGWVLMLTGVVGILLTTYFWNRRRVAARVVVPPTYVPPAETHDADVSETRVEKRRVYGDGLRS